MLVGEVMNKKVKVMNSNKTVEDAARLMQEENFGAIPIEENDRMVGMLTDRDIVLRTVAAHKNPAETKVKDIMSPGIDYCYEQENLGELVKMMKTTRHRRIPVINEKKRLVGIVTLADLVTKGHNNYITQEVLEGICNSVY